MRDSGRMGIETVAKSGGQGIMEKLWCGGGVWGFGRVGLSEHTKVVVL